MWNTPTWKALFRTTLWSSNREELRAPEGSGTPRPASSRWVMARHWWAVMAEIQTVGFCGMNSSLPNIQTLGRVRGMEVEANDSLSGVRHHTTAIGHSLVSLVHYGALKASSWPT